MVVKAPLVDFGALGTDFVALEGATEAVAIATGALDLVIGALEVVAVPFVFRAAGAALFFIFIFQ